MYVLTCVEDEGVVFPLIVHSGVLRDDLDGVLVGTHSAILRRRRRDTNWEGSLDTD